MPFLGFCCKNYWENACTGGGGVFFLTFFCHKGGWGKISIVVFDTLRYYCALYLTSSMLTNHLYDTGAKVALLLCLNMLKGYNMKWLGPLGEANSYARKLVMIILIMLCNI